MSCWLLVFIHTFPQSARPQIVWTVSCLRLCLDCRQIASFQADWPLLLASGRDQNKSICMDYFCNNVTVLTWQGVQNRCKKCIRLLSKKVICHVVVHETNSVMMKTGIYFNVPQLAFFFDIIAVLLRVMKKKLKSKLSSQNVQIDILYI